MEKLFTFYVAIPGTGKTVDEAWASAQESFVQSNIQTPEVVGSETSPDQVILGGLQRAGSCALDMGEQEDGTGPLPLPVSLGRGHDLHVLTSSEEGLLVDALYKLRQQKTDALNAFDGKPYKGIQFTGQDFGIPDIDRMIKLLSGEK